MRANIDGGFQQRAARRPNNTAAIVVCSVNLILRGVFCFGKFPCSFSKYSEAHGFGEFPGSFGNYLKLVTSISATYKNWSTSQIMYPSTLQMYSCQHFH